MILRDRAFGLALPLAGRGRQRADRPWRDAERKLPVLRPDRARIHKLVLLSGNPLVQGLARQVGHLEIQRPRERRRIDHDDGIVLPVRTDQGQVVHTGTGPLLLDSGRSQGDGVINGVGLTKKSATPAIDRLPAHGRKLVEVGGDPDRWIDLVKPGPRLVGLHQSGGAVEAARQSACLEGPGRELGDLRIHVTPCHRFGKVDRQRPPLANAGPAFGVPERNA